VRIQRQRRVLYQRLKVPPSINAFSAGLEKGLVRRLISLLNKYVPLPLPRCLFCFYFAFLLALFAGLRLLLFD
jgi:hypothetical protein